MTKFLMLDTETTNSLEDPLYYDLGCAVIDTFGNVYEKASFVNADVFLDTDLMKSAYFAEKIPTYWEEIKSGTRQLKTHNSIRLAIHALMKKWDIHYIVAHNARFDYKSTTTTQRLLTCSRFRYFFPYGTQFLDTLKMARRILKWNQPYIDFCTKHNFLCKNGKPRFTAEIIYRFLTNDTNFLESHTGLEDAIIEAKIFAFCISQIPENEGLLW